MHTSIKMNRLSHFYIYSYSTTQNLHSFPTRRSSDLQYSDPVPARAQRRRAASGDALPEAVCGQEQQGNRELHRRSHARQIGRAQRLNSSHEWISYAVFCLKKKKISNMQSFIASMTQ